MGGKTSLLIAVLLQRTPEASQVFLLSAFSASFCPLAGKWLAGMEAPGAAPDLSRAAFGEGIALAPCVLCWP